MGLFTLKRGKERPVPCRVVYEGQVVYTVSKADFNLDKLLEFLGSHAAEQYFKNTVGEANYDYMKIEVREWEVMPGCLLLPVYVCDISECRYIYRMDANTDIVMQVVTVFNMQTNSIGGGASIKGVTFTNNLVFTKANMIIDALHKGKLPFLRVVIYQLLGDGRVVRITDSTVMNDGFNTVANDVDTRITNTLRADWDTKFDPNKLTTIIEVELLKDVMENGDMKMVPKPADCLSMLWTIHCFLCGCYTKTFVMRVEVYDTVNADLQKIRPSINY